MSRRDDMRPDDRLPAGALHGRPVGPPDVFLSYARADEAVAARVARVLSDRGWSVWSDHRLLGGQRWRREIDEALDSAKCVVVLWSTASAASHWVMDEAGEGMRRGILVPALLQDVEIPLGFREVQAIDLSNEADAAGEAHDALVAGVARVLGTPAIEPVKPPRYVRLATTWGPPLAAVLPAAIAIPILLGPVGETVIDLDVTATQVGFTSARQQEITDLMILADMEADGLASIRVPRTRAAEEQLLRMTDGRGLALLMASGGDAVTGSLTLPAIAVARGSRVTLAAAD